MEPLFLDPHTLDQLKSLTEADRISLHREWRQRLLSMLEGIRTPATRRDWLLHMSAHTHDLGSFLDLVTTFNKAQGSTPDHLMVRSHALGFFFGKSPTA